jgi:hypothetical protein
LIKLKIREIVGRASKGDDLLIPFIFRKEGVEKIDGQAWIGGRN